MLDHIRAILAREASGVLAMHVMGASVGFGPETRRVPFLEVWIDRAAEALQAMALRPQVLFLVALALNALAQPYAGLIHDARLYSVQTRNRLSGGVFADDLFLRYGSQDQYSLFSTVATPLVSVLGLEWSFFLLYLAGNSFLLWAYLRLLRTLLDDPALAAFASISVAILALPFGGLHVFHVLGACPRINTHGPWRLDEVGRSCSNGPCTSSREHTQLPIPRSDVLQRAISVS